ncbi:MAG: hypothetical protein ACR2PT_00300 [Endozoicomonas sp.]
MWRYLWIILALAFFYRGFADSAPAFSVDLERLDKAFPGLREVALSLTDTHPDDVLATVESIHSQWVNRQEKTEDHRSCLTNIPQRVGMHYYASQVLHKLRSRESKGQNLAIETLLGSWGLAYSECSWDDPEPLRMALKQLACMPEPGEKRHLRICQLIRAYDFAHYGQSAAKHYQRSSMYAEASLYQNRSEKPPGTSTWEKFTISILFVYSVQLAVTIWKNGLLWRIAIFQDTDLLARL